jgi:hypothetical protein
MPDSSTGADSAGFMTGPHLSRLGRLLRRGQDAPDQKAAGLCRELRTWWPTLWTFARVDGVEPTNDVSERAVRPAVLWRKGSGSIVPPAGAATGGLLGGGGRSRGPWHCCAIAPAGIAGGLNAYDAARSGGERLRRGC